MQYLQERPVVYGPSLQQLRERLIYLWHCWNLFLLFYYSVLHKITLDAYVLYSQNCELKYVKRLIKSEKHWIAYGRQFRLILFFNMCICSYRFFLQYIRLVFVPIKIIFIQNIEIVGPCRIEEKGRHRSVSVCFNNTLAITNICFINKCCPSTPRTTVLPCGPIT